MYFSLHVIRLVSSVAEVLPLLFIPSNLLSMNVVAFCPDTSQLREGNVINLGRGWSIPIYHCFWTPAAFCPWCHI